MKNLYSLFFDSFEVSGDKITIHKCMIDSAIKRVKNDPDPFESGERVAGRLDILNDLQEAINRAKKLEQETKYLKELNK